MSSMSFALLLIFFAHGQTGVGKEQNSRSRIHFENTAIAVEALTERGAKSEIETREIAMIKGVVEEVEAITSAVAIFIETTPVLKTLTKLVYFVLHRIAEVIYAYFQVLYNINLYNPIFLLQRELFRILVAVIEYILNLQIVQHLLNHRVYPAIQLVFEQLSINAL